MRRQDSPTTRALAALVLAVPLAAQDALPGEPLQDSTRDNLVLAEGTPTAPPGSLGAVVEAGRGPIDVVLVSGFGLGASVFADFTERNAARYHMLAVTIAGFEGSAPPPMPAPGTSYAEQTWTRAAAEGVARLIEERRLTRPVLIGHFIQGTQVAAQVALAHPERVRALVLFAGTPRFDPPDSLPTWPRDTTPERRATFVDQGLAPQWFKTVTPRTWVAGNFVAGDYSMDEARGRRFADVANAPPLPVLVRALCEFHAVDLLPELGRSAVPLLLLQPAFTEELRADAKRSYLQAYFETPWQDFLAAHPGVEAQFLDDAGILVMDDRAEEVDQALARFLERHGG